MVSLHLFTQHRHHVKTLTRCWCVERKNWTLFNPFCFHFWKVSYYSSIILPAHMMPALLNMFCKMLFAWHDHQTCSLLNMYGTMINSLSYPTYNCVKKCKSYIFQGGFCQLHNCMHEIVQTYINTQDMNMGSDYC